MSELKLEQSLRRQLRNDKSDGFSRNAVKTLTDYLAEDANLSQQTFRLQYLEIPQMEIIDLNFGSFYVIMCVCFQ